MNFTREKSKNYTDNNIGAQGLEREKNRARFDAGKGVGYLARALADRYPDPNERMAEIDKSLKLQNGMARVYHAIHTTYVKPAFEGGTEFAYKFLCGTPYDSLLAFAPFLRRFYTDPSSGLADRIWLTTWSIEVFFNREKLGGRWWDLRELSVEEIKNLDHVFKTQSIPLIPPVPEPTVNHEATESDDYNFEGASPDSDDDDPFGLGNML
jgi:hypothetical protein